MAKERQPVPSDPGKTTTHPFPGKEPVPSGLERRMTHLPGAKARFFQVQLLTVSVKIVLV